MLYQQTLQMHHSTPPLSAHPSNIQCKFHHSTNYSSSRVTSRDNPFFFFFFHFCGCHLLPHYTIPHPTIFPTTNYAKTLNCHILLFFNININITFFYLHSKYIKIIFLLLFNVQNIFSFFLILSLIIISIFLFLIY